MLEFELGQKKKSRSQEGRGKSNSFSPSSRKRTMALIHLEVKL